MRKLVAIEKAEAVKMRHTFIYPLHVTLPVCASVLFLLYYYSSVWSGLSQISGFMEVVGISLPLVISLICAGNIGLEEGNHFQIFLGGTVRKWDALLAKWIVLSGGGFLAVSASVILFAAGEWWILGNKNFPAAFYGILAVSLWAGSVLLYMEHLFLNLLFVKQVSLCVGVAQSLLSALFLTGLGEGRWQFFPCTWSARGTALILAYISRGSGINIFLAEMKNLLVVCALIAVSFYAIIRIWFQFYEGRQCNE